MRRFDPGYVRAKKLIDDGELGRIEQFRALSRDTFPPSLEYLLGCGGSFLDMSVHDLDLARFLVGEVEEVHAWASVLFDDRFAQANDWDTSLIMLKFRNGALGVVETSRHSEWGYDIRTEVAGAVAKVVVDGAQKTAATVSREFGWEGDLYESFPDRFEVAYRRELEVFFEDLGAGRTRGPGPGRCPRDLEPGAGVREELARGAAGQGRRDHRVGFGPTTAGTDPSGRRSRAARACRKPRARPRRRPRSQIPTWWVASADMRSHCRAPGSKEGATGPRDDHPPARWVLAHLGDAPAARARATWVYGRATGRAARLPTMPRVAAHPRGRCPRLHSPCEWMAQRSPRQRGGQGA